MGLAGFGSSEHAVIIGLDGLSLGSLHTALGSGHAPHLKSLRDRGAVTDDARSNFPSLSLPNWASTLFSAPPTFHGVHSTRLDKAVRPATYAAGAVWPNVFTAARAQRPGISTAAYYSWPPLSQLLPSATLNTSALQACGSCDECLKVEQHLVASFAAGLKRSKYALSWLYIDVLDECGHKMGGDSAGYPALVKRVDSWVGQVLDALRVAGIAEQTTLLMMSDHGRDGPSGRGHGGFSTEELATQWLLVGPSIRRGHSIRAPVSIMDGAPTLLHALGLHAPVEFYGRVVAEAFEGGELGWSAPNASASLLGMPRADATRAAHWLARWHGNWHGHSLVAGAVLGAAITIGIVGAATAAGVWPRKSQAAARPQFFTLGPHPAADRLRAAAGEPDYEMQGLLR